MSKKLKVLLAVVALFSMLFALTGCGGNKLVATKKSEDSIMGKYEEKIEIKFKKDKADKIVWTMKFDKAETAKSIAGIYNLAGKEAGVSVKQSGKKVVLKMDAKAFANQGGSDSSSKDELKKELEEKGYKVK